MVNLERPEEFNRMVGDFVDEVDALASAALRAYWPARSAGVRSAWPTSCNVDGQHRHSFNVPTCGSNHEDVGARCDLTGDVDTERRRSSCRARRRGGYAARRLVQGYRHGLYEAARASDGHVELELTTGKDSFRLRRRPRC